MRRALAWGIFVSAVVAAVMVGGSLAQGGGHRVLPSAEPGRSSGSVINLAPASSHHSCSGGSPRTCSPRSTLSPSSPIANGGFGGVVASSGRLEALSAAYGASGGVVYVYQSGMLLYTIPTPAGQSGTIFGNSLALGGQLLVVADDQAGYGGYGWAGAVYVYQASTGVLLYTLTSPNPISSGFFGYALATDGNRIVVGAPGETAGGNITNAGHAYVYQASTGKLFATLTSPNAQTYGWFGAATAALGKWVVVGAFSENPCGPYTPGTWPTTAAGAVYLFNLAKVSVTTLDSPHPAACDSFGFALAVQGSTLAVGASSGYLAYPTCTGEVYVFNLKTTQLRYTVTSPGSPANGCFGEVVALSGARLLVGAPEETSGSVLQAGNAYDFSSGSGALRAILVSAQPTASGFFGAAVAVSGGTALVGAPYENAPGSAGAGEAYLFNLP